MNAVRAAWDRIVRSVRARPAAWAVGSVVVVAAVATGAVASTLMLSDRQAAGDASDDPLASTSASASVEPSASATPSDDPSPTGTATASPTPSASPTPVTAQPTPTATPVDGHGGAPAPSWDIAGTWAALPAMPAADAFAISDVLMLDDGRLVVFRWQTQPEVDGARVLTWSPDSQSWLAVRTETILTGTDAQFAQGADGRIYSYDNLIDPSSDPWQVDSFALADPSEVYAGYGLDSGPDGRLYRPRTTLSMGRSAFEILDPTTGERTNSSVLTGLGTCVLRGEDRVFLIDTVEFTAYDPASDRWSETVAMLGDRDCYGAGFGPDGRLYVASMWWEATDYVAWDFARETWLSVEPPPASEFRPHFLTGPGGRLWAVDSRASFVFTPSTSTP